MCTQMCIILYKHVHIYCCYMYRTPEPSGLPPVSNDQGAAYNRIRSKPVFKSYGKSAGCFDLNVMTTSDITDDAASHDPFYIGMMANKNAGNPFHKYLVR